MTKTLIVTTENGTREYPNLTQEAINKVISILSDTLEIPASVTWVKVQVR